jgi:two-component system, chemotaxis family, CheB/CheR fusion protein
MNEAADPRQQLEEEIEELRARLLEAEDTLRAIQQGEVDALVVNAQLGDRVYTLRSPDHSYRLMIEEMAQGAVTLTAEGLILYCNGCFARILKDSMESVVGSSFRAWVAPGSRDLVDALLRRDESNQGEIELLASDGSRVPVYLSLNTLPLEDDSEPVLCLVVTDLTEQKRNERIVADELLARSILEHAAEATVVCDTTGKILRASREAHRLCGHNPLLEPFEQAFPLELASEDIPDTRAFLERALAGNRVRGLEASLSCGQLAVMLSAGPLWGPDQSIGGCVVTFTDITTRRNAERELKRAWAAAQAVNEAKDRFLATLSHELRTPLTPVLAVLSNLEAGERLPTDLLGEMTMMRRNIELEARLIDDLLDLTRISRGKLELQHQEVDPRQVLEHAIQTSCGEEIAAGRLKVVTDLEAGHRLWADGPRLTQVFWNLLNNAVKFTPEGGAIFVRSWSDAPGWLTVEVSDTGVGIDPEFLSRIFDAFEQGEPGTTRRFVGLGLGLAISKTIAELHGGALAAHSEGLGRGATFQVRLPLTPVPLAASGAAGDAPLPAARSAQALRILLVEDHADTAAAMADLLRDLGHEVTVAGSVSGALAAADEIQRREGGRIDIVLSDLGLPDASGLDLMRELAQRYGLKGIALSGYGMEEDLRRSLEAGFEKHLTKPINFQALQAVLQEVVGR